VAVATRCQGNNATQPINEGRRDDGTWQVHSGGSRGVDMEAAFATIGSRVLFVIIIPPKPVLKTLILFNEIHSVHSGA